MSEVGASKAAVFFWLCCWSCKSALPFLFLLPKSDLNDDLYPRFWKHLQLLPRSSKRVNRIPDWPLSCLFVHLDCWLRALCSSSSFPPCIFNVSMAKSSNLEEKRRTGETSYISQGAAPCHTSLLFSSFFCVSHFLFLFLPSVFSSLNNG